MTKKNVKRPGLRRQFFLLKMAVLALLFGCHKSNINEKDLKNFQQINLVANSSEYSPKTVDATLLNAFGIAWTPSRIAWVNSVGGHVSELYTADGDTLKRIKIPSPTDSVGGFPCGIVNSTGKGFNLSNRPSNFLFSGFEGVLSGWNGALGDTAQRLKKPFNAHTSYTGLALGASDGHNFIYAANFGEKKINVWGTNFAPATMSFQDNGIPDDYSPYNIQAVGNLLFVMYAKLGADGHGVAGRGNGYVDVFNTNGVLVQRFASRGTLNIPWGVVMAPGSFLEDRDMGDDGGVNSYISSNYDSKPGNRDPKDSVVLVGNFGDGRINVFSQVGQYLGQLQSHNSVISIDGLWSLSFAPSASGSSGNIDPMRLYFTAGPEKEQDGLFGYLIKQ